MRIHTIALLALGFYGIPSSASAALLIQIDKSAQTLTVIRDGETMAIWPVSTGRSEHPTPSGSFTAFRMEADHYSKEWDDAPMPHSIFFTKLGHAIHGSFEVKRLGSPASHGCVRLAPENAAVLFALVTEEGLPNTKVVLTGSEQVALARINAQRTRSRRSGVRAVARPIKQSQDPRRTFPPPARHRKAPTDRAMLRRSMCNSRVTSTGLQSTTRTVMGSHIRGRNTRRDITVEGTIIPTEVDSLPPVHRHGVHFR